MLMHKLIELNRKVHNFYEQKNVDSYVAKLKGLEENALPY